MTERQGNLSINSENMLPIIKKWLYSDHDIFVREVISNACDAISKLHKLEIMGEYQYPDDHKDSIHAKTGINKLNRSGIRVNNYMNGVFVIIRILIFPHDLQLMKL